MPPDMTSHSVLEPLDTKIVGHTIEYRAEVGSTNDVARAAAAAGAPDGWTVVADTQTAGRGRFNRRWLSPPGSSIATSFILRPNEHERHWLSPMAALAAARAIEVQTGLHATLKWPNDILANSRKVGGVLVEADGAVVIIGVGINVNFDPRAHIETTGSSSLSAEMGVTVSRLRLLRQLLRETDQLWLRLRRGDNIRSEWQAKLETLGKAVRMQTPTAIVTGIAEAVDELGALIIRDSGGSCHRFMAGEVTMHT